jgi:hypothetical protein
MNDLWTRRPTALTLLLACLLVLSLGLAACGGDDDDSGSAGIPLVDGADEIESAELGEADMNDVGFEATDGRATAYVTDTDYAEVTEFYSGDLEDGWSVVTALPMGNDQFTSILNKDNDIAVLVISTGAAAKANPEIMDDDTITLDPDDIDDDDTLIMAATFACGEDDIQTCLADFQP